MSFLSAISKLEKRAGWTILGLFLTVLSVGIALYAVFFQSKAPSPEFEQLSNTPVLDVHEKLPELEVLYQGHDIARSGQTVSVVLVRFVNRGSANLLSTHFDVKAPIGLRVGRNASVTKLISAELSSASSKYLSDVSKLAVTDSTVSFDPVILEPNEWFTTKILVLHDAEHQPSIYSFGKIAGWPNIPIITPTPLGGEISFWAKAFSGNVWFQLIRSFGYTFGTILGMTLFIIPIAFFSDERSEKKRKALIDQFKTNYDEHGPDDEFVFQGYIKFGSKYVRKLIDASSDIGSLRAQIEFYDKLRDDQSDDEFVRKLEIDQIDNLWHSDVLLSSDMIFDLRRFNVINQIEGEWEIDYDRIRAAAAFLAFIETHSEPED